MSNQITLAFIVYMVIAFRFFCVFRAYEKKVLSVPRAYNEELTNTMLFKIIINTRTVVVSLFAPIIALFVPSYLSVLFHGIELKVAA